MSCGAIVNFAATANRLKEAQELHKLAAPSSIRRILAPFKALASELSTDHKKVKVVVCCDLQSEGYQSAWLYVSKLWKMKDSVLNTVAEKLGMSTGAIPTPVRKLSAPLKTVTSELSPQYHNNNDSENDLLNTVAQKFDEAKDTVVEKTKEAVEFVAKEAKVVNEKLEQIAGG